jgi:hypothetical protein
MVRDDNTRYLLPPIAVYPEDIFGPEMPFAGNVIIGSEAPALSYPTEAYPHDSLPLPGQGAGPHDYDFSAGPLTPLKGLDIGSAPPQYTATLVKAPQVGHFATFAKQAPPPKHPVAGDAAATGSHKHHGDGHGPAAGHDGGLPHAGTGQGPLDSVDGGPVGAGHSQDHSEGEVTETEDGNTVTVKQIAIVDQDAAILVSGYIGQVVADVHIDQNLQMDQDVNIAFSIDGDGHFNLKFDQGVEIDQDVQIEINIFDDDEGVLHVQLYLHDTVDVDQHTDVDMSIGDGPPGGSVSAIQDVELNQNADINIDVEDELEERYLVNVQVETKQKADVDQDALVDVKHLNGHTDIDVDAIQTATVEQQTIVHADFALV